MQIREYLSVRRAFSLVRRASDKASRLTFEEFSILCHLHYAEAPLRTSDIAEYQHVLRPTMTHRTNRLEQLGYIRRFAGESDRRTVCCGMTEAGEEYITQVAQSCVDNISAGMALNRAEPERMLKYSDAMGQLYCTAGDLVAIALAAEDNQGATVSQLVGALGLLQPTVSMAVAELVHDGLLQRKETSRARSGLLLLTEEGLAQAREIGGKVEALVVRRRPRKA